jgi:hypothetical protein
MFQSRRFGPVLVVLAGAVLVSVGLPGIALCEGPPSLQFSKQCLMVNPNEGCALADVNRDGKPDVIAGTHWYAAPEFVPRPLRDIDEFLGDFMRNNGDHPFDVDGDGWLDVISGSWHQAEIYWFKNPGEDGLARGMKWERRMLAYTRGQNEAFALWDLDGDGTPEIIPSCWYKEDPLVAFRLVKGSKDRPPTLRRVVLGMDGGGHGWAFGDLNGDGREDILCETGWYERPEGNPFARRWRFHPETALPHPSCPFLVVDLNGDGRNDLIWGRAHDFGLYWWEQGKPGPDGTTTWTEHLIDDSWSQAHCLVWTDLDGDGREDLITGKRVRGHGGNDPGGREPACLYYYTWDAAAGKFHRHTIGAPGEGIGTGMQIAVGDLNGDGRPDIAVAGKTGTWLLFNEGPAK